MLRGLIERGHVRETPNPRDGRSTLLELTPAGQAIFDTGIPAFHRALARSTTRSTVVSTSARRSSGRSESPCNPS